MQLFISSYLFRGTLMSEIQKINRRKFIASAASAAALLAATGTSNGQQLRKPLDRPVRLGFVGTGNRGTGLIGTMLGVGGVEIPAICDIDAGRLAETLGKSGYATAGIVSHRFIDRKHGLAQGFQIFDESQIRGHDAVTSEDLTGVAIQHLEKLKSPFLMWIHYFDPHYTYVRHSEFQYASGYRGKLPDRLKIQLLRKRTKWIKPHDLDYIKAVYDEEIAYTDYWIGKLLEHIESMGLDQSTVIILTADHGEYFLERGRFFHGKDVYRELIHVPLVISGAIGPQFHGKTVDRPVEILSIPKTVAELIGISNHSFQGENLLTLIHKDTPERFVFAEGSYALGTDERKATVIYDGWKLIRNLDDDRYELYNLSTDPQEKENLWETENQRITLRRKRLREELDRFVQNKATETQEIEMNEEEMEHLRSLGYVQ